MAATHDGHRRPLSGLTVVDITTSIAGPSCTATLGALGADVVKIERPPLGDDTRRWGPPFWSGRSAAYLAYNASKRSVALDLKRPRDHGHLLALIAQADIFVHNLRRASLKRFGLEYENLRELNTHLVYCSISAFGYDGPRADEPGYDPLMQAASGIMSLTGDASGEPVRAGVSLVDQGTGLWAVVGILAALRERAETGTSQLVETSLYETAMSLMPYQIVGYLASGEIPTRHGSGLGILAPYEAFGTQDGRVMIAAGNDDHYRRLCGALGTPELLADPRFATNANRVANRDALRRRISQKVSVMSTQVCLDLMRGAGVPAAPVRNIAEALVDPQTRSLELLHHVDHPGITDLQLVAIPMRLNGKQHQPTHHPPELGEHNAEVISTLPT